MPMERLRHSQLRLMMVFLDRVWIYIARHVKSLLENDHVTIHGKYDPLGNRFHELPTDEVVAVCF